MFQNAIKIRKHWGKNRIQIWKELMRCYLTIEKTLYEDNNKIKQFNEVWIPYEDFEVYVLSVRRMIVIILGNMNVHVSRVLFSCFCLVIIYCVD